MNYMKEFITYHLQDTEKVQQTLLALGRNELPKGLIANGESFRQMLHGIIEEIEAKDQEHPDWPIKEVIIGMISLSALDNHLQPSTEKQVGKPKKEDKNEETIAEQIGVVAAFLRAISDRKSYTPGAMRDIVAGRTKEYDRLNFVYTLRECFRDKYYREVVRDIVTVVLAGDTKQRFGECSWYDAVVTTLYLHLVYSRFGTLTNEMKTILLNRYFYQGIVCGAPVRKALSDELYETSDAVTYMVHTQFFFEQLGKNIEIVDLSGEKSSKQRIALSSILGNFLKQADNKETDQNVQKAFVEELLQDTPSGKYLNQPLVEAIDIYVRVKEAVLIDHNHAGEHSDKDLFLKDVEQLTLQLASEATWGKVKEYFSQPEPRVPLQGFLGMLRDNVPLDTELAIKRMAGFGEFLHKEGMLPVDIELLEFNEKDGAFHWAPSI